MGKKKVCKRCKLFTDTNECPVCKTSDLSPNFQGRIAILDADTSYVAKKMNIKQKGEYAIKVR
jgi:DNA-directed RNA polymerase subunit E"